MASLTENTATAAYGTLGDLSGNTPGFHATAVYAGTSLESPVADHISGVVSARSGNTLTVHGATFLTPPVFGTASYTASYANNATVTIGSATVVGEDGVAASGLTPAAISVGQQLDVSGQGSVDSSGNVSLDATACSSAPPCQVRLAPTRIWGTLNSATPGGALLDVLSLGNFARSEEHTSELQSRLHLVCRLLLEKKKTKSRTLPDDTARSACYLRDTYHRPLRACYIPLQA